MGDGLGTRLNPTVLIDGKLGSRWRRRGRDIGFGTMLAREGAWLATRLRCFTGGEGDVLGMEQGYTIYDKRGCGN